MSITTDNLISPVWTRVTSIVAERAEGAYVYDQDGSRYLDFTSGIGVTNTGHCHPKVVQAIQEQATKLLHGQANIIFHDLDGSPATDLAKAVVKGCLKRHLLLLTCGPWDNTVRWIPPLVVTQEQIEEALVVFKQAVGQIA